MANQISVNTGSGAGAQQVIVDSNGNITVTVSRSVIGTVANVASANYANFAGTVVTAAQPNITSVGTLSNLTVANTITTNNLVVTGNFQVGNLVANSANYANFAGTAFAVAGANVSGTVANATFATTAGSANTANSATVAASANSVTLANVSGAGNIASINLDGNVANVLKGNGTFGPEGSTGNANYANFAGTAFSVSGSNVSGAVANATFAANAGFATTAGSANTANTATVANSANAVAGANVSGTVANATYAANAGFATTASSANTANSATVANSANSVTLANVSGAGNIAGINLDGNVSNLLTGNGTFVAIPTGGGTPNSIQNGNSVVDFTGVDGNLNISTNNVTDGVQISGRALNINGVGQQLDANLYSQLNIANGSLGILQDNMDFPGEPIISLITHENVHANINPFSVYRTRGNITNPAPVANGDTVLNNEFFAYSDSGNTYVSIGDVHATVITNDNAGNIVSEVGIATSRNDNGSTVNLDSDIIALNGNSAVNITALDTNVSGNLTAAYLYGDGSNITGVISANANYANFAGNADFANYVGYAVQNTTNTSHLVSFVAPGLTANKQVLVNGNFIFNPASETLQVNQIVSNGALLTNITGANVSGTVANATYATSAGTATTAGTVTTNAQPNITSVGNLSALTVTGALTSNAITWSNVITYNGNIAVADKILIQADLPGAAAVRNLGIRGGNISNASASNTTSGGVFINSGQSVSTDAGNVFIARSGTVAVSTGTVSTANGAAFSGGFQLTPGSATANNANATSGATNITTGAAVANNGNAIVSNSIFGAGFGNATSGNTLGGNFSIIGANARTNTSGNAQAGNLIIIGGNATSNNGSATSGNVSISTALANASGSGTATVGSITLEVGSPNGVSGNVRGNINIGTGGFANAVNIGAANTPVNIGGNLTAVGTLSYLRTFGSFTSNATQTSNGANTTNYMTLNNTEDANGISIASSTQITVARTGRYNIQFSAQVEKTDSGSDLVEIWLDKNGTSVPNSATQLTLVGNGAKAVAAWDFNVNAANVNDYFRIAWASPDTDVRLTAITSANTISGVALPSVIVDINPIGA